MTGASLLTEAELHGLVDGHLVTDRRADVLRRAAASPADRARIDAWQDQNDLIRSAFGGVEREPLPAALDLRTPPRLVCVPAREEAIAAPQGAGRLGRAVFGLATVLVVAGGLSASWMMVRLGDRPTPPQPVVLRGEVGPTLAEQTVHALDTSVVAASAPAPLPTSTIPDLTRAGFSFTGAETQASSPASLVFHYRNGAAEHVVVGVSRSEQAALPPALAGQTVSWHRGGHAYAVAGTVEPGRLQSIAVALQRDAAPD